LVIFKSLGFTFTLGPELFFLKKLDVIKGLHCTARRVRRYCLGGAKSAGAILLGGFASQLRQTESA